MIDQIEYQFSIQLNSEGTENVFVYLPVLKKDLSVKVAGGSRMHQQNLFQTMIQWLGDAQEWGTIPKTWENLAAIVEIYLNFINDNNGLKLVDFSFTIDHFEEKLQLAKIISQCFEADFLSEVKKLGLRPGHTLTFLRGLRKDKCRASLESIYVIATIFKINVLVIDADQGVKLVEPWIPEGTDRQMAKFTICIFQEVVGKEKKHFFRLVARGLYKYAQNFEPDSDQEFV